MRHTITRYARSRVLKKVSNFQLFEHVGYVVVPDSIVGRKEMQSGKILETEKIFLWSICQVKFSFVLFLVFRWKTKATLNLKGKIREHYCT